MSCSACSESSKKSAVLEKKFFLNDSSQTVKRLKRVSATIPQTWKSQVPKRLFGYSFYGPNMPTWVRASLGFRPLVTQLLRPPLARSTGQPSYKQT